MRFLALLPILDTSHLRGNELVRMCAWCKAIVLSPEEWGEIEESVTRLGLLESAKHRHRPWCVPNLPPAPLGSTGRGSLGTGKPPQATHSHSSFGSGNHRLASAHTMVYAGSNTLPTS